MYQYLVSFILVVLLLPVILTCVVNPIFEKRTKRNFKIVIVLVLIEILTELLRDRSFKIVDTYSFFGKAGLFLTFMCTPFLCYYFIRIIVPEFVEKKIRMFVIFYIILNSVVTISSFKTHLVFIYDSTEQNFFHPGRFFFVHYYTNCALVIFAIVADVVHKIKNKYIYSLEIFLYLIVMVVMVIKDPGHKISLVWPITTVIIITYFINYVNNLVKLDTLSGVYNRRMYDYELKKCVNKRNIYIINIDINYFKSYNDQLGHDYGDKIIKLTAEEIKKAFSRYGKTFRVGGDEFCVICYKISSGKIKEIFEKINSSLLSKIEYKLADVLLSYGYEKYSKDCGISIYEVVSASDENMYKYKKNIKMDFTGKHS